MNFEQVVQRRLDSLTKPRGSLGRLEEMLLRYAAIRGAEPPRDLRAGVYVFCGDHGVVEEGVSAWPSEVTRQMALNFVAGGAAISVLCRHYGVESVVIDMGIRGDPVAGVHDCRIANGTRNFAKEQAMTREQALAALAAGKRLAQEASERFDVVACGEMGIGNTTAAAALLCAYSGFPPERVTGAGAGLDAAGIARKADVIARALERHASREALDVAAAFGGFEILGMAGMILGAAERRLPVVLDGFISCSAALIAAALEPKVLNGVIYSHCSAETGHRLMLLHLNARPMLDLEMRLGEGTGAALAIGMLQAACRLYHEMATFTQASVSEKGEAR